MKTKISKQNSIPAYIRIADKLRSVIKDNSFKPGDFIGTEVELSKDNSITRMTARRAVQILIDEGLLERQPGKGVFVKQIQKSIHQIKLLSCNLNWMPSIYIGQGMKLQAEKYNAEVILCDFGGNEEEYIKAIVDLPKSKENSSAVLVSIHNKAFYSALLKLELANYKYVVVDEILNEFPCPSISSDNIQGGKLAVQTLLNCGHKKIGFIGDVGVSTTEKRFRGGTTVLAENSLTYSCIINLTSADSAWEKDVLHNLRLLKKSNSLPSAFFCSCDAVARYVYRAANKLGLAIPDDISVIGFDDDPIAEWLSPGLTTIRQPFEKIGKEAIDALMNYINGRIDENEGTTIELPVDCIDRNSVKIIK